MSREKIPVVWTKGMKEGDQKSFEETLRHNHHLLARLSEILEEWIAEADKQSLSKSSYDNPNWPYLQADLIGYKRALTKVKEII